jgi:hypothetical protein
MTDNISNYTVTPELKKEIDDNLAEWVAKKKLTRTNEQIGQVEFIPPTEEQILKFKKSIQNAIDVINQLGD